MKFSAWHPGLCGSGKSGKCLDKFPYHISPKRLKETWSQGLKYGPETLTGWGRGQGTGTFRRSAEGQLWTAHVCVNIQVMFQIKAVWLYVEEIKLFIKCLLNKSGSRGQGRQALKSNLAYSTLPKGLFSAPLRKEGKPIPSLVLSLPSLKQDSWSKILPSSAHLCIYDFTVVSKHGEEDSWV